MIKIVNGVEIEMTPEEIADWEAEQAAYIPPEPPVAPLSLHQIAAALLDIDELDITGIERSQGIGAAMMLDASTAWLFFSEPQADTSYIVIPSDGVTKFSDYIEVACPGATQLALIVQRVQ